MIPTPKLPIETERLRVQVVEMRDSDDLFTLHTDPAYVEYIGQEIIRERFDMQFARSIAGDPELLSLTIRTIADSIFVGEIVLLPSSPGEIELVVSIVRDHRRKGYAEEVAHAVVLAMPNTDGVSCVMVCVEDSNVASMRLVESLGMVRIGRTERYGGKKPWVYQLCRSPTGV